MADDPHDTAFNQSAPADERFDANARLANTYRPSAGGLIPPEALKPVFQMINDGLEQHQFLKASNIMVMPETRGNWGGVGRVSKKGMQSLYIDRLQVTAQGEYYEKQTAMGFSTLRTMVEQTPILSAVVQTRIRQVNRFCGISEDGGPGFEIRHRDRRHVLTSEEQIVTELLAQFMQNCGWEFSARARKRLRRDTFPQFMAKSMRDSLSMDSCPIETEQKRDKNLGMDGFYAVDGATVRLCMEDGYQGDDEIYALQVVEGRIVTGYTNDQLIYEVRNPRSDVRVAGYGMGEPELMVRVVTGFLNAMTYNIRGFDENSIPKGLLHLSGDYGQEDLIAFRRYWNAMVRGINNTWTLPVMVSKDQDSKATFETFGQEFNEMHFSKWMSLLTSIICAIYGMDPGEINFESFSADKSSLSGSDTGEKLAAAQDKGLRPFMSFYEGLFTDFIIKEFSEKYVFRWVGLESEDPKQVWEEQQQLLTVNEARAEKGYEVYPIGDDGLDMGQAPLNPALVGIWAQKVAPPPTEEFGGPAAAPAEDFGEPGQGDGAPPGGKPPTGVPAGASAPPEPEESAMEKARAWVYSIGKDDE